MEDNTENNMIYYIIYVNDKGKHDYCIGPLEEIFEEYSELDTSNKVYFSSFKTENGEVAIDFLNFIRAKPPQTNKKYINQALNDLAHLG